MATNYTTYREHNLSGGEDSRSAENLIPRTFSEIMLNAEKVAARVRKRKGHQGVAGYVPVRVTGMEYSTGTSSNLTFTLDDAINLSEIRNTPLVAYGKVSSDPSYSSTSGFISTADRGKYYSSFSADPRKELTAPSGTLTLDASEHGYATANLSVGTVLSTSAVNNSWSAFIPDQVETNQISGDVDLDYSVGTSQSIFVFYADKQAVAGSVYVSGNTTVASGATSTISISAGTHGLSSSQMRIEVFQDTGSENRRVIPDRATIASNADVEVEVTNSAGTSADIYVVLSVTPTANIATGSVASGATESITITNATSQFYFVSVYLEDTPGGDRNLVLPDSVSYSAVTDELTVQFTNDTGTGANFEIYYEVGEIRTNRITVTDEEVSSAFTDTDPQITLWGLCHELIYGDGLTRPGWVTHIDRYRRTGESRILCGLGGNLFGNYLTSELSSDYLLPTLYPRLRARLDGDVIIGPLFHEDGATPARTRGYITSTTIQSGQVDILSAAYNSGTGYTDYVLSIPDKAILDSSGAATTLASVLEVDSDYLTVSQMGHSKLSGEFLIKAIDDTDTSSITVSVLNSAVVNDDYDEAEACGLAGVFTDKMTLLATSPFIAGDEINSDGIPSTLQLTAIWNSGAELTVSGAVDVLSLSGGLRIAGSRTSRVIPMRDSADTPSATNLVAGDNLVYNPITRQLRAVYVNPNADDTSVSIVGDGNTVTFTLSSTATAGLTEGQYVLISQADSFDGEYQITDILSSTVFTALSTTSGSTTGTLVGHSIQVDESLSWSDTVNNANTLSVPARWIPIEVPEDSFDETDSTRVFHFDDNPYEDQPFLRSTISNNNMYLSNGDDEVLKFDGTNIYRSGLFRWESGIFINGDTSTAGKIDTDNPSITISGTAGNKFLAVSTFGDEQSFRAGDRIEDNNNNKYTIESIQVDEANATSKILLTSSVVGSPTSITRLSVHRYYYRLNAVDANNNLVGSATTGSQDFVIELGASAGVRHRIVGLPSWDIYDYDRLEVEIYRTLADTAAPYYKIATLPMSFDNQDGYLDFIDSVSDDELSNTKLDPINSVLLGQEIGTAFSEPLRAKYVTSANNRLVLANVKGYPELDLRIEELGTSSNLTISDLDGLILSLRRNNTGTASTTDMSEFVTYEFVESGTGTTSSPSGTLSTSFTFTTSASHGLSEGDWIYLYHTSAGNNDLTYAGWWQVATGTTGTTVVIRYKQSESGAISGFPGGYVVPSTAGDVPVYLGTDYNSDDLNWNLTTVPRSVAGRRLTSAINCSMRMVDRAISGLESFTPWIIANGGGDFAPGQVVISQPRSDVNTFELVIPSFAGIGTDFNLFVNSILRSASSEVSAITRSFPSRVLISFENYPEIFDAPTATIQAQSLSIADVNSSDGQEITGAIPFFGDSVSQDSQKEPFVVIFKTNSVYLINIQTREITKLETQGQGCTAPYSISTTRDGVFFANDSGMYRITRGLQMEYLGKQMERRWEEEVNRNRLDLAHGHHFNVGRQYKLSVPIGSGSTQTSQVYVYDHTDESVQAAGAWSRFDSHDSTGWTNLDQDAYWASTRGRVLSIRRAGDNSDYRDDDQAISFDLTYRALDFGNAGSRKAVAAVITHFRVITDTGGTKLLTADDLRESFIETTAFRLTEDTTSDGLSDALAQKVISLRSSMERRKLVYLQLKWTNSEIDEPVEIAGFDVKVGALSYKGIKEAADT